MHRHALHISNFGMSASCVAPPRGFLPPGPQSERRQVIVMGMSRSGTSLTASIVAALLGGPSRPQSTWRGTGPAYPKDSRTGPAGYFERRDVVSLNYEVLRQLGQPWSRFPPRYASEPKLLDWGGTTKLLGTSPARRRFEAKASSIIADMSSHARAWVLKDVRFSRTLPLWAPLLSRPVCIIPYRHPAEVASSSLLGSISVWESYLVAALSSARALGCPTLLLPYHGWMSRDEAPAQLRTLVDFLRCAGVRGLDPQPAEAVLNATVHRSSRHQHAERAAPHITGQFSASAQCLWRRLNSGAALRDPPASRPC